jgi:hypothetical protein
MAPAAKTPDTDEYRVVVVGVSHKRPGKKVGSHLGRRGEHIELDRDEAERLLALGAIVRKGDPDPEPAKPVSRQNPYGGSPLETNEEHAARVTAEQL